jgi:hypothetical protein
MAVAREAKSPLLERVAIVAMITSAITGIAVAALHAMHMLKRDLTDDRREKEKERDRRSEAASPPERPAHGGTDAAGMPDTSCDGGERRWTRREEQPHAYARHR